MREYTPTLIITRFAACSGTVMVLFGDDTGMTTVRMERRPQEAPFPCEDGTKATARVPFLHEDGTKATARVPAHPPLIPRLYYDYETAPRRVQAVPYDVHQAGTSSVRI